MCFSPVHIVNPSTWIDPESAQPLFIDVPCGHCSECIVSYRNEWRNRAYYESLGTFLKSKDSYILFDTLTYRNGCLPHLSDWVDVPKHLDFPCFNYSDFASFMVRLRRKLSYLGYDVGDNLRYFMAQEYGDDIRFTRRPHMHVLFFVTCSLPLKVLSLAISDCWIYGRTDGVKYRGYQYVLTNNYFTGLVDSERFAVNYVTKYCTKQFSYNDMVNSRLDSLIRYDFALYEFAKDFVNTHHYQSRSFGHDALINIVGRDRLLNEGRFRIIQKNGFTRFVNLHKSLQRKLLYDYSRDEFGRVKFTLNSDGYKYKKKFFYRQLDFLLSRVAGDMVSKYAQIKEQIYNLFFVNNRFKVFSSPEEVIDNSYNINHGLRNYSAVDYSFFRKRIFAAKDFGSKKLGFENVVLSQSRTLPNENQFISLQSLKDFVVQRNVGLVDSYFANRQNNGDSGLDVLKLLHRLNHIHKNQFSYV